MLAELSSQEGMLCTVNLLPQLQPGSENTSLREARGLLCKCLASRFVSLASVSIWGVLKSYGEDPAAIN